MIHNCSKLFKNGLKKAQELESTQIGNEQNMVQSGKNGITSLETGVNWYEMVISDSKWF
jgi:hypothetical protein